MARRGRSNPDVERQLVVIGSSAGGIDALSQLLQHLPTPFPAPIVVAQHLDPRRPSHLAAILAKVSPVPVVSVEDSTKLEEGTVYLLPATSQIEFVDHTVTLQPDAGPRPVPSIDRLLEAASAAYGEGLVAVILTGAGSDGAAGARLVKLAGGTVVIQDPETAEYPAMPMSLAPTTVDVVSDLSTMGGLLVQLVSGEYQPRRADEETILRRFLDQMAETSGIDFSKYKRPTILRRLHRRMVAAGVDTLSEYVQYVRANPEEMQRLASSLLIKVTEFFRDPELYRYLRDRVVPELIEHAAEHGGELRFWSAGCATGEEAYSLAIIAAEALGDRTDVKLRIFATDVDPDAVEFARRGVYPPSALARVPAELRQKYFSSEGGQFEVDPAVRRLIAFGQHDLAQRAPFPRIDLAVCRNVLIYFTHDLQRRALQLFAFSLREGGFLALGKAETSSPLGDHFVVEEPRLKIYRRRGVRVLLPAQAPPGGYRALLPVARTGPRARLAREITSGRSSADLDRARSQIARADALLHRLPVGLVLVDRKYDIVSINAAGRSMLGVHGAAIGQDLVHLAQGVSSVALRRGIDAAFRGEPWRERWDIPTVETVTPDVRSLEVTAYRQPEERDAEVVVLLLRDVSAEQAEMHRRETELADASRQVEGLRTQLERMQDVARSLREANEELTQANVELRAQNDELLVSNEEVQAATEEVETLNEEMQATNEELETLNEEMQATVEELNTTNDDLEARSTELQNLAVSLEKQREVSESERARLAAVLLSMADAVLVVDAKGRTVLTNAAFDEMFGADGDTDQRIEAEDGTPIERAELPRTRAARGERFSMRFIRLVDGERRWYEASGRPIESGHGGGGVVVIRDISERNIQQMQSEFLGTLSHELRTPLTGLVGYLDLMARDLAAGRPPALEKRLQRAIDQARRFGNLVDELFDANRLRSGRMTYAFGEVDLGAVVDAAIDIAGGLDPDRPIDFDKGRANLRIRGDASRLQQVVFNLVANAIHHAPGSEIEVHLRRRGRHAELTVTDHGPGIPADRLGDLFSAERSPSEGGGLGLGLYIARGIVEAHGGTIDVDRTRSRGASFRVRLPLLAPPRS